MHYLSSFAYLNGSVLARSHLHNLLSAGSTDEQAQCLGRPLTDWVKVAVQKVCGSAVGLMDKEEAIVFVNRAVCTTNYLCGTCSASACACASASGLGLLYDVASYETVGFCWLLDVAGQTGRSCVACVLFVARSAAAPSARALS